MNTINCLNEYDESSPESIEQYAKKLIGKTFYDVINEDSGTALKLDEDNETEYGFLSDNIQHKGNLGEIIEKYHFHYKCNNSSKPDFDKAGVELKVTPYRKNNNGTLSAKERLIIMMIDYLKVVNENFYQSHFWSKAKLILIIYYLYEKEQKRRFDYRIDFVNLFTPPECDINIIKTDYDFIINKIKNGKAHELSGADTMYLEAAPKAADSTKRKKQPFSNIMAKPRAFAYKNSYMTYVLNKFLVPGKEPDEDILPSGIVVSFEDYVVNKISEYRNYGVDQLCQIFGVHYTMRPKNLEAMVAFRILGIKTNKAAEFEKANIVVKTIRITDTNKLKESMSFPTFKFKEIVEENWDDSVFASYLRDTKFLFVIFKSSKQGQFVLKGCQFWHIPYNDLETDVKSVWEKTKKVLKNGLEVRTIGKINYNNLPKSSQNVVCHVRPHARNSSDTYDLPTGGSYLKQCFWLNRKYILSQIDKKLLE